MNGYVAIALGQVRHSPDSIMICSFEEVTIYDEWLRGNSARTG